MSTLKVDTIQDQAGLGAPDFDKGLVVSATGITLPTGSTALTHYEEFTSSSGSFEIKNGTGTFNNPGAGILLEVKLIRIGNVVTGMVRVSGEYNVSPAGTTSAIGTTSGFLPVGMRPTAAGTIFAGTTARDSGGGRLIQIEPLADGSLAIESYDSTTHAPASVTANTDSLWIGICYSIAA